MNLEDEVTSQTRLELEAITRQAFEILVGFEPCLDDQDAHSVDGALVAMVGYDQATIGSVIIECSPNLAYEFTSRLMDIERPSGVDANVVDALGELANTVGGNYKGLLSSEVTLTSPKVLEQEQWRKYATKLQVLSQATYQCVYGICVVRLVANTKT